MAFAQPFAGQQFKSWYDDIESASFSMELLPGMLEANLYEGSLDERFIVSTIGILVDQDGLFQSILLLILMLKLMMHSAQ